MEMGWCEQYEIVIYFNEGGRTAFSALLGAVQRHGSWHVLLPKKRPHQQAARLVQQQHRAEVRQKGSKKIVWAQLGKAWRAMCTVEDKTGIPLPGCAIGSARARWA
jgi:hypothetical protein